MIPVNLIISYREFIYFQDCIVNNLYDLYFALGIHMEYLSIGLILMFVIHTIS